jgi:hypothetical protein
MPWVERNFPIPPGICEEVCAIVQKKITAGIYEPLNSSYSLDGSVFSRRMEKHSDQYTVSNHSTKLQFNIQVFPLSLNILRNVSEDVPAKECWISMSDIMKG